jgi:hypothetical protein
MRGTAAAVRRLGRGVTVEGSAGTTATAAPGGPEEEEETKELALQTGDGFAKYPGYFCK